MPAPPTHTPVAIVGAGPVGLMLALGLARHGVRSTLVERKPSTSPLSKAPVVHTRTMEALRQWGVLDRFLDAGVLLRRVVMHDVRPGRGPLVSLDFSELDEEADPAGLLVIEQGQTERLLLEAVRETGMCEVRFSTEAVALDDRADRPCLKLRRHDADQEMGRGDESWLEADYVVGCDGAGSFVRSALGLPFDGLTYSVRPILADVLIDDARDELPWPRALNGPGGYAFAVRIRRGHWRLIRLEPGDPGAGDEVPAQELRPYVLALLGPGPFEMIWSSRFRIHRRSAPRFRVGRVLLAGDAAHIHSPVGGMGMNAGMLDAHNLAWKLAAALGSAEDSAGGRSAADPDRILASYDVERREAVVEHVTRYTDVVTRIFLQTPSSFRAAAFVALRTLLRAAPLRRRMQRRAAMIDLDYSGSPMLDPRCTGAGQRLPNPRLRASDGRVVRLHSLLGVEPAAIEVSRRGKFSRTPPADTVVRIGPGHYADPTGRVRAILRGRDGVILVRPDLHVERAAWHGLSARDRQRPAPRRVPVPL